MDDERSNIIKTKNIKKSLQEYASSHNMAHSHITFSLRAVKTYIKTNKNTAFQLFNENVYFLDLRYENFQYTLFYIQELGQVRTHRILYYLGHL